MKPIVVDETQQIVLPAGTPLYSDLGKTVAITVSTEEPRDFGAIAPGFRAIETRTGGLLKWLYARDNVGVPVPRVDPIAAAKKAGRAEMKAEAVAATGGLVP